MNMTDRYRKWFEYEIDSYEKVFASFETVPESARSSKEFQKAVMFLAHLVAARNLWLFRLVSEYGTTRRRLMNSFLKTFRLKK